VTTALRSRLILLAGILRCVSPGSIVSALRVAAAGRGAETADAIDAVPIRMRACGGEPLYVRPGSSDLLNAISYYRHGSELPPPGIENPRTIVEVGSNCGVALTALALRFPEATLIGAEADAANVAAARRNLERFGERATVVQAAIWDREAEIVIDTSNPAGEHAYAVREAVAGDSPDLPRFQGTTVDALLAANLPPGREVDYLHVSIEGTEPRVFAAGGEWVGRTRSLRVELHEYFGYTAAECIPQLEALGFHACEGDRPPHTWVFGFRRD